MLRPMLSYAQNGEDVVLRRIFADRTSGFYVDVGACDPVDDSVTQYFYELGWRGVNIEPDRRSHTQLAIARPRDINLHAAIGAIESTIPFYPSSTRGHGTVVEALAADHEVTISETVQQMTLARVLADHVPPEGVEFLKVDAEGSEADVLSSVDWCAVRPRVVLVEAINALGHPSHVAWEATLLSAGYQFGLFDGINRFYCRDEDATALLPRLAAPACVLDNWRLARELRAHETELRTRDAVNQDLIAALAGEQAAHSLTRETLALEKAAHAAVRGALTAVHTSTSWRVTAPLRDAMRLARLVRPGG